MRTTINARPQDWNWVDDRLKLRELRPDDGSAEQNKMLVREAALIAADHSIVSRLRTAKKRYRSFKNAPGRIAILIKQAEPELVTGNGIFLIKSLLKHWRFALRQARKLHIHPILFITINQINALKDIAVKAKAGA